jgi:Flp pilus assembly protein TadD
VTSELERLGEALRVADRHRRERRFDEADALCRRVLQARPNSYEAEHLLGTIAHQTGRLADAIKHFRRTVELAPHIALHHANLGEVYRQGGQTDEAEAASRQALALDPDLPGPWHNLAFIAFERHQALAAIDYCRKAIDLKPDLDDAYNTLGLALKELGRLDEARQAYLKAIEIRPSGFKGYVNLTVVHKFAPGDRYLAAMERLAVSDNLPKSERPYLDFALGNAYRDVKDYARSFRHLAAGNAALRAETKYDESATLAMFRHIERVFTPALIAAKSGSGDSSSLPIFVVGMPRSGTTLVEQILASHPLVHAAGELSLFGEVMLSVRGPDGRPTAGPAYVAGLDSQAFEQIGSRYVERLRALAPGATRITDKRPNNYYLIGLIHLALPNAKIVHVVRDPADTCLSCFAKYFLVEHQTYDLGELGRYYRHYQSLMAHWRRVLPPGRILDVRYEDVVADLESQTRRLLDYCGLDWDERCLSFHRTERPVRTASAAQVRQPIFDTSIGRWRDYEEFLGPLLAELRDERSA